MIYTDPADYMGRHLAAKAAAVAVTAALLTGCGDDDDGNAPPEDPSGEYTTDCDGHGNLVYLTEDDTNATPNIFVVPGGCDDGTVDTDQN